MPNTKLNSLITIWVALIGLTFTSIAFYDFNPKLLCVEITEERGEDGGDFSEEDGFAEKNFDSILDHNKMHLIVETSNSNAIIYHKVYATSTGHILDLIKPPLN